MSEPNTDATGITTVATSYDEAVKAAAGRRALHVTGVPMPDTPQGVPHLNPALTPAPIREVIPERIPVPVINDPGLVGANPDLGLLNQAYRDHDRELEERKTVSIEDHNEAIRNAALAGQDRIGKLVEAEVAKQVDASQNKSASTVERPVGDAPEDIAAGKKNGK